MNELSWLLYLGNVSGNLQIVFGILVFMCIIIIFSIFAHSDIGQEKPVNWWPFPLILIPVFLILIAILPSQSTVYAIAASQIGQKALEMPLANKAEQALESWLDKQIKDDSK